MTSVDISSRGLSSRRTNAVIRYDANGKYDESEYSVRFHRVTSGVKKLLHTNPATGEWVPWKYADEPLDFTQFKPDSSDTPTSGKTADSASQLDYQHTGQGESSQGGGQGENKSSPSLVPSKSARTTVNTATGGSSKTDPVHNNLNGQSQQILQLSSLFTAAVTSSSEHSKTQHGLLPFINNNLKYTIVLKFSGSLSRSRFTRSGVEGYDSSEMIVNTACDMLSFLTISNSINKAGSTNCSHHVRYNPSTSSFINPSRATTNLSVDFRILTDLLEHIQLRDMADWSTISVKRANKKTGRLLRILASSCVLSFAPKRGNGTTVNVDCVLPSQSMTATCINEMKLILKHIYDGELPPGERDTSHSNKRMGSDVLFFRFRENYDEAQGRFLSPWKATTLQNSCFSADSTIGAEQSCPDDSTFSLEWSSVAPVPKSVWTSDAVYFGEQVLGTVTAFFPSVTFFGEATTREIETLISEYL